MPAALLLLGAVELALLGTTGWVASVGLEAAAAIVLVFRRTHPLVAAPLSAVLMMAIPLTGTRMDEAATPILFYILGIYSLGRYLVGHSGLVALALTLLLIFADFFFAASGDHAATDVVFVLSLAVPPYVFGRISRRLALQSEQLAQQQELIRGQAVREERDRIARELHDVIAHSVSAMVVQTAAAQDLVRTDPDKAERVLGRRRRHRAPGPRRDRPAAARAARLRRRAGPGAHARAWATSTRWWRASASPAFASRWSSTVRSPGCRRRWTRRPTGWCRRR